MAFYHVEVFSPFIFMLTNPELVSFDFANKINVRSSNRNTINTTMLAITVMDVVDRSIIGIPSYNSIPIKLMNPSPINPVIIKVIPKPLSGAGTLE